MESTQSVFDAYFLDLGLSEDRLPKVELTDSRSGSWIMEAALMMFGTVGTTYTIPERIEPVLSNAGIEAHLPTPVQSNPVSVTCSIDARPLRGLTPDVAKSHSIHLAVAVSRCALSVENLGDASIENLRIGLFKSATLELVIKFPYGLCRKVEFIQLSPIAARSNQCAMTGHIIDFGQQGIGHEAGVRAQCVLRIGQVVEIIHKPQDFLVSQQLKPTQKVGDYYGFKRSN